MRHRRALKSTNEPTEVRSFVRIAIAGVMVAASCAGIAGPTAAESALLNLPTPPRDGGPVVVTAGFDLRDINEIDDEAETFEFEGGPDARVARRAAGVRPGGRGGE